MSRPDPVDAIWTTDPSCPVTIMQRRWGLTAEVWPHNLQANRADGVGAL